MEAGREREQPQVEERRYIPDIYRLPEGEYRPPHHMYDLNQHTLKYITHLPGDTTEDDRRMNQYA
eukprot:3740823-Amphidinium_carterae.1